MQKQPAQCAERTTLYGTLGVAGPWPAQIKRANQRPSVSGRLRRDRAVGARAGFVVALVGLSATVVGVKTTIHASPETKSENRDAAALADPGPPCMPNDETALNILERCNRADLEVRSAAAESGKGPDHVANYVGGAAARLRSSDGTLVPGDVYLLMATLGSDARARLFDQTPFTHDHGDDADTVASNIAAAVAAESITGIDVDIVEFTSAPGGGTSGGLTYLLAYLNIISDGAFTADLRVAATGELGAEGYIGLVSAASEKVGAARVAGADVMFTSTAPSHAKLAEHTDRHVGQTFRSRHGRATLAEERRLHEYQAFGATRPDALDLVAVGHIADVAAYLCGAGSQFACVITDHLGGTITSDTLTPYDLTRLAGDARSSDVPVRHPSLGLLQ